MIRHRTARTGQLPLLWQSARRLASLLLFGTMLVACSTTPAPTAIPKRYATVDVNTIPNPTPHFEPLSTYGNPNSYTVLGQTYYPMHQLQDYVESGVASWYGMDFHGQLTSNRETYDIMEMTAAHRTLPIPSYVRVTNLENQHWVIVRINDRGPFRKDRIIDLSYAAAKKLDIIQTGTAPVLIESILPWQKVEQTHDKPHKRFIQIGVYRSQWRARQVIQKLPESWQGLAAEHTIKQGKKTLYAVWLGPLYYAESVKRLQRQLTAQGFHTVVKSPS